MQQYPEVHTNQQLRQELHEIVGKTPYDPSGDPLHLSSFHEPLPISNAIHEILKQENCGHQDREGGDQRQNCSIFYQNC